MRILLDGSSAVIGTRAIKRYTNSLIHEFVLLNTNDEFKILLSYFRGDSNSVDILIKGKPNFSKIRYPIPRRFSLPLWHNFNFPRIDIFTGKVDIFHSLGDDCPPVKSATYIITLHGITYMEVPELMNSDYVSNKKAWLYKMARKTDFLISVSEHTKNEFLRYFPDIDSNRIEVIPLGIDRQFRILPREITKKQLLERYEIRNPYILYVGGIEARKNVINIVKGFHEISDKHKELQLILVGGAENNYLSLLETTIKRLRLDKRIRFIGYVAQEGDDLPLLYNGAECFVYPSFSEGWTSPPLEAMACGTSVIASRASSLPETVGDAALLVDPYNHHEIGQALDEIISEGDLRKDLIKKGLRRVSGFTWEKCAQRTYSFYKQIIDS